VGFKSSRRISYEIDDEDLAFLAELPPPDRRICTRKRPSSSVRL
jgi:hypothetical protein